jgi:hypothetical protein
MDQFLRARAERHRVAGAHRHFVREGPHTLALSEGATFAFLVKTLGVAFFLLMIAAIARSRRTPWFFEATAGAFILTEVTYVLGNYQTYSIYRVARDSEGISGTIKYSWWLRVRLGVSALIAYGWLYASLGLVLERPLLVGGALGNWGLAVYLWRFRGATPRKVVDP